MLTVHERYAIAMKHAKKFVSTLASRPILQGVFHAPDGSLAMTDSHRLLRVENAHDRAEPIVLNAKTNAPIDGVYPDISRVIPTNFRAEYTLSGNVDEELAKWITAHEVAVKIGDKKLPVAIFSLTSAGLSVEAANSGGKYRFDPNVAATGCLDEFTVHYNAKYVLDALLAIRDFKPRSVSVKFAGNVSPFVFETDNGVLALILPIKTN